MLCCGYVGCRHCGELGEGYMRNPHCFASSVSCKLFQIKNLIIIRTYWLNTTVCCVTHDSALWAGLGGDSGAPAGMWAQLGAGGRLFPHKAAGQLFTWWARAQGVRVEVIRPLRPWFRTGHIPLVEQSRAARSAERAWTAALDDGRADSVAPLAQGAPRVSEGCGSAQGQAHLHMRAAGVEACGGDSHQGSSARPWGPPHAGPPPSLALLRGGFARAGVCNQKVQRPFHCA